MKNLNFALVVVVSIIFSMKTAGGLAEKNVETPEQKQNLAVIQSLTKLILTRDINNVRDFLIRLPYLSYETRGSILLRSNQVTDELTKILKSTDGLVFASDQSVRDKRGSSSVQIVKDDENKIDHLAKMMDETLKLHVYGILRYVKSTKSISKRQKKLLRKDLLAALNAVRDVLKKTSNKF